MTTIDHPFLKLEDDYLYPNYRYNLKFYRSESKYNWKKHIYESHYRECETTAVFSHQTEYYYIFKKPYIRIKKENLIQFKCISYEV